MSRTGRVLTLAGAAVAAGGTAAAGAAWLRRRTLPWRDTLLANPPLLIAHRGGAGLAPENTLAAFRQAVDAWAVDMIEMDVRATADGHCVVIHDATVDRTTDGTGPVSGYTLEELRRLDAGYRFTPDGGRTFPFRGKGVRIPTVEEVLEALPTTPLVVELKTGAAQRAFFRAVRRAGAEDRVVAAGEKESSRTLFGGYTGPTSASLEQLRRFYMLHRARLSRLWAPPVAVANVPEVWEDRRIVTPRFIRDLHAHGIAVQVWTVNRADDMHRLMDWGVDGIITDRPDRLSAILTDRAGRPVPAGAR